MNSVDMPRRSSSIRRLPRIGVEFFVLGTESR
jgi:hypothetical protein